KLGSPGRPNPSRIGLMMFRCSLVALVLLVVATDSEAYPRRRVQPTYQYPTYQYPAYQYPSYQPAILPTAGYTTELAQPITPAGGSTSFYTPVTTAEAPVVTPTPVVESVGIGDGLDEVNAKRAARGLRPFIRDEGLTQAARACAAFRADNLL